MGPVLPWLIPSLVSAGAGLASWLGGRETNKKNEQMADKQMEFQEKMSSSSAQRSVEDYTKAGLNPALAYDRPASSPAGAMSRAENAAEKGVSSAMQARALVQNLENMRTQNQVMRDQNQADMELKGSQKLRNLAEGALAENQSELTGFNSRMIQNQMGFRQAEQPFELRSKAARALLDEFMVPGARNQAGFEGRMGQWSPGLRFFLNSAGSAARIGSGLGITR